MITLDQYFIFLSQLGQEAENLKHSLCSLENFESYSYWSILTNNSMLLNINQLQDQFPTLPVQGIAMIFKVFDSDLDGNLNFSDFFDMIISIDNPTLRQEVTFRKVEYKIKRIILINARVFELLQFYCTKLMELQQIKQQLHFQIDFNVYLSFCKNKNLTVDHYTYFLVTKEYSKHDENVIKFQDFYKFLSNQDNNAINELFSISLEKIQGAQEIMKKFEEKKNLTKNKQLINKQQQSAWQLKNIPKQIQYFSVQTNDKNENRIFEDQKISEWTY
ncbi:unnamed protein product (macronuclear) [Paramecium tetraurelia]|uniref:EF-hand domain-containing protein n=1 Tax=Paramecium tetraurelia TaxID=5888 RepID=A0E9A6_PARTE|nr:uncharacterized protein GSPATT00024604001 [Paramecium tetraurelia]CAK91873.1 unnamed protein product [Paramecium tetraurelia]|eukprot:XP_001459270.1 hypothetical protein (macronuclear) [Paramecium tetraurelia strain d4-2]